MSVIFGTGYEAGNLIAYENELGIEYFIDNDKKKIGKNFKGYDVRSPETMVGQTCDCIILSSKKYASEMKAQLLEIGIDDKKIINGWELEPFSEKEIYIESDSPLWT